MIICLSETCQLFSNAFVLFGLDVICWRKEGGFTDSASKEIERSGFEVREEGIRIGQVVESKLLDLLIVPADYMNVLFEDLVHEKVKLDSI